MQKLTHFTVSKTSANKIAVRLGALPPQLFGRNCPHRPNEVGAYDNRWLVLCCFDNRSVCISSTNDDQLRASSPRRYQTLQQLLLQLLLPLIGMMLMVVAIATWRRLSLNPNNIYSHHSTCTSVSTSVCLSVCFGGQRDFFGEGGRKEGKQLLTFLCIS